MSLTAKAYITIVIGLGSVILSYGMAQWNSPDVFRFCCYLLLAVPASCMKVVLPGVTGTMSVLFLFLLAGIVELGLPETLIIGIVCVSVQSYWRARVRPRAVQIAFSIANISLAITTAHYTYYLPVLSVLYFQAPFRLVLAASVFFIVNTFTVAIVIALTEGKAIQQVWRQCYCWSFPYYLVGAGIVGIFAFANRMFDWQAGLLILPVVYGIYRSYWLYLDQLQSERTRAAEERRHAEEERRHAQEERRHAEEIASLHAQAVAALRSAMQANAKLDAVIQASPLAILGVDVGGNVTSWNTTAECIFGWTAEQAIGRPLIADGQSEDVIRDVVSRTLRGELLTGIEVTQRRKDGTGFDAAIWTAPLGNRAEGISGALVTVADVSDRKRLEEQLRLSQKMEAVGRLAGGIAHDFNNLLTVINGYSAMLTDSVTNDPYAQSQAEQILAAGTRAAELVSKLLAFSRRQVIKPRALDINQFVRDVERMLRRLIGEHIELRTELDADAGWIRADVNQMETVLLNLATNARDAMPQGGVLSIHTACVELGNNGQRKNAAISPGSYVRLVVKDTGHGMDRETQEHLFEPFFTTKETGKGTGLGLSSVYGGVQQNGGRIFVSSQLGKGTAFSIYLPRLERPASAEPTDEIKHEVCKGKEIVLLVEDEAGVRRMLREVLSKAGYRVWEASNGAEAIRYWGERIGEVDLVVTDIVMPVMNGLKLAEELHARRPELKLMFMSGHAEEVISVQGGPQAVPNLLQKPFLPSVLISQVRAALDDAGDERCSSPSVVRAVRQNA